MALAPVGKDGQLVGSFTEKTVGNYFEFDFDPEKTMAAYPYRVWVAQPISGLESGWRYARILKTVAYIIVDENDDGVVVEKWDIKNRRDF